MSMYTVTIVTLTAKFVTWEVTDVVY